MAVVCRQRSKVVVPEQQRQGVFAAVFAAPMLMPMPTQEEASSVVATSVGVQAVQPREKRAKTIPFWSL